MVKCVWIMWLIDAALLLPDQNQFYVMSHWVKPTRAFSLTAATYPHSPDSTFPPISCSPGSGARPCCHGDTSQGLQCWILETANDGLSWSLKGRVSSCSSYSGFPEASHSYKMLDRWQHRHQKGNQPFGSLIKTEACLLSSFKWNIVASFF